MIHSLNRFVASDGYSLAYRHWPAVEPVRGCVVALHGIQSHSGWYTHSSDLLSEAGYEVYFPDRRGSGVNGTDRGHAVHADRLIQDVCQFLTFVISRTGQPPTLTGISWGGKLASVVAATRPDLVSQLALMCPGLRPRIGPSLWQRLLLQLAGSTGRIQRRVKIPLRDPELFTSVPEWQNFIRHDHLALHQVSVGFLLASLRLDQMADQLAPRVRQRLLLMLAGRDRIIDNQATRHFGSRDRTIIEYPEACHTLEFESGRDTIVQDYISWLNGVNSE